MGSPPGNRRHRRALNTLAPPRGLPGARVRGAEALSGWRARLLRAVFGGLLAAAGMLGAGTPSFASRVLVGPGGDYTQLEDAINGPTWAAGDTLELAAGTHAVTAMLRPRGSGAPGSPIVVRGAGRGVTIVSGERLDNSKALWDVEQANRWWVFEDMTVRGMRGAQTNARGFFLVGCEDVVLQRLEITDCWNGIMSASGATRVTVQFCDIHHCGGLAGPAHNIYMSGGSDFVIQYNWIHDAQYGTCYKDRTRNLLFQYNRVENAAIEGYEISLAGGAGDEGTTVLLGNLILKSPTSAQQNHFVRFEDGRTGTLHMVHNTLVAQPRNVVVSSIAARTILDNNLIVGGRAVSASGALEGRNNWIDTAVDLPAGLQGTLRGARPQFVDAKRADYRLGPGSPCIDAADPSVAPAPRWQWDAVTGRAARSVVGAGPDIGAFEATGGGTRTRDLPWTQLKQHFR